MNMMVHIKWHAYMHGRSLTNVLVMNVPEYSFTMSHVHTTSQEHSSHSNISKTLTLARHIW